MPSLQGATVLVTGGSGFVGGHLLERLRRVADVQCHATTLAPLQLQGSQAFCRWHQLDTTDSEATNDLVASIKPDVLFHLAAQSHVPTSFDQPQLTWEVNLQGTLNLLDAAVCAVPRAVFVNVASSDIYGRSFQGGAPINESSPLLPLNPYAASKAAADLAAFQYSATTPLKIIRARPFNHSGTGQGEGFVLPAFAAQIARIEAGLQEPMMAVGDLSAERDFLHIDDVVSAYMAIACQAADIESGAAFNIASGRTFTIADMLGLLLAASTSTIEVRQDPARLRPVDIPRVCGDSGALRQAVGWQPQKTSADLVADLLTDWRARVRTEVRG
ncbi:MAG: GDP-mannose 4,6-dehydratase [Porticoccaceae bacterium]